MAVRAVHHVNCGTMCPLGGPLFGSGGWKARLVAHCLLLETDKDGLVLVDTGYGMQDVQHTSGLHRSTTLAIGAVLDPAETAIAQVEALGFKASDVRHIVVTHLDMDHAGGLPDFQGAKVHLHAREHIAAVAPTTFMERRRYVASQLAGARWEVYAEDGDTWRGLPAITKLRGVDADIGLLPMHGHTRGHSAVLVNSGSGWLVHAGDAYFHRATVEGRKPPIGFRAFESTMAIDDPQRRASAAALRQLHATYPDVDIFCSHDPSELARFATKDARGAA
ncbi:MAG TPA: MBL fold metallo-hydrolase [Kofleriaceae bacterium]|jgi:glyoxylase-like metal-dependent hydrolase (beta-lactamase superfamily II)